MIKVEESRMWSYFGKILKERDLSARDLADAEKAVAESKSTLAEKIANLDKMQADVDKGPCEDGLIHDWTWFQETHKSGVGILNMYGTISPDDAERVLRWQPEAISAATLKVTAAELALRAVEASVADKRAAEDALGVAALTKEHLTLLRDFKEEEALKVGVHTVQDTLMEMGNDRERAAWIRAEVEHKCVCNHLGQITHRLDIEGTQVEILLDGFWSEGRHLLCDLKRWNLASEISKHLPERFSNANLRLLKTWPKSPISMAEQEKAIAHIPSRLPNTLHGWLLVGPPGTSKTTYATAGIRDWLTWRIATEPGACSVSRDNYPERDTASFHLSFYVVHVPDWLEEMQAWEHRDFGDETVEKPKLTPKDITAQSKDTNLRPILLLEEVDKFTATENRRQMLFRLVDAVYRADGVIVTTANTPLQQLKELVGEPVFRRLSGSNDLDESYMVWDFFRIAKKVA